MIEALILGIIQGLTEFLPVSSTAHLVIFPWFFNWNGALNSLTFDVALHTGTLLALLICFWKDWIEIIMKKQRLFLFLLLASLPAGIVGLMFNHYIETVLRSPYIIILSLAFFGIVMLVAEKSAGNKNMDNINLKDALIVGISQAVALIPGVSRSGITISAGLFRGMEREAAARFSFMLSTPAIAGATLLHARKMFMGYSDHNGGIFLIGFVVSAITGLAAIKFLLSFFRKHPMNIFAYYRFALAAVILIGIWLKA